MSRETLEALVAESQAEPGARTSSCRTEILKVRNETNAANILATASRFCSHSHPSSVSLHTRQSNLNFDVPSHLKVAMAVRTQPHRHRFIAARPWFLAGWSLAANGH